MTALLYLRRLLVAVCLPGPLEYWEHVLTSGSVVALLMDKLEGTLLHLHFPRTLEKQFSIPTTSTFTQAQPMIQLGFEMF